MQVQLTNKSVQLTNGSSVHYYPRIPANLMLNKTEFWELWDLHPEEHSTIKIYNIEKKIPRWNQAYGLSYTFSGTTAKSKVIPKMLEKYLDWANTSKYGPGFNMILVNWYANGTHYIGYHSDDERQLVEDSPILCFSFGAQRTFCLKNKKTKVVQKFELCDNSLIVMVGSCQKTHKHSLPVRKKVKTPRISITLRKFKTRDSNT